MLFHPWSLTVCHTLFQMMMSPSIYPILRGRMSRLLFHTFIPISPSTAMSATFHGFGGCRTFFFVYLLSHQYAASATIDDAALYGVRTLDEGFGRDCSILDSQMAQIYSSSMFAFIHTLSLACLGFHPSSFFLRCYYPYPTYNLTPCRLIRSLASSPSSEVVAAMQNQRSVIAPTLPSHSITIPPYSH